MLEDVFDLPFERRARPAADEVATLECAQIRFQPGDELIHRSRPERAADHRRCLEGRLVGLPEQVDARGEDRLHRVRDVEAGRQLRRVPRTVRPLEDAGVDQAAEHFLDEERVSLRALHDKLPHRCRELGGEQRLDERRRCVLRQRLEPDRLAVDACVPPPREIGPACRQQQKRPGYVARKPLDQVEQGRLCPMHVLDQDDDPPFSRELREEGGPGGVQAVPSREWMEVARDVEAQRQPQDLALAEPAARLLRRIAFEDRKVLLQDLRQRPVRDALAVGEAAADPPQRARLLVGELLPELAHQPRLAEPRVAEHRDEHRP